MYNNQKLASPEDPQPPKIKNRMNPNIKFGENLSITC